MTVLALIVAAVGGYLLGSIPVAVIVGRRRGVDPRVVGDRNPGYWNTKETLGARAALPVFVGDTVKGTLAGLTGLLAGHAIGADVAGGPRTVVYVAVAAAMIGHAWPVFAGFVGGRSILTFAGGLAVVSPPTFAVCVALCIVVSLVGSFSTGARVGVFAVPLVQLGFDTWRWAAATFLLMSVIGVRFAMAAVTRGRSAGARGRSGGVGPAAPPTGGS
ncbi:MAG: hypothetical protein NVS3B21_20060 [Acidimicrobiales bacterium]